MPEVKISKAMQRMIDAGYGSSVGAMVDAINQSRLERERYPSIRKALRKTWSSGIGTLLHQIIKRETGQDVPCSNCKMEIAALNQQSPDQVMQNIEDISSSIISRGHSFALKWYHHAALKYTPGLVSMIVKGWIKEACQRSVAKQESAQMKWAYGVTTVLSRLETTLPKTLESLLAAGFDNPDLYVDGLSCEDLPKYSQWPNIVLPRAKQIKTAKHWILTIAEIYLRDPFADRYALFQDDLITYPNLREYLERVEYPRNAYLNLFTFPSNQSICPKGHKGFFMSNQLGRGALALVFSREAMMVLLSSRFLWERSASPEVTDPDKSIDGGISEAFKRAGWHEYVHNPSLVQHIGAKSSMGNARHPLAQSFRGEGYDALRLLE